MSLNPLNCSPEQGSDLDQELSGLLDRYCTWQTVGQTDGFLDSQLGRVHELPTAAVTNVHQLGGLKQYTAILHLWRSKLVSLG